MYRRVFYLVEGDLIRIRDRVFRYLDWEGYKHPETSVGTWFKITLEDAAHNKCTLVIMRDDLVEVVPKFECA